MKTNKRQFKSNFKGLGQNKNPTTKGKKHHKHLNKSQQMNRSNIKGHNLHDLVKKVA